MDSYLNDTKAFIFKCQIRLRDKRSDVVSNVSAALGGLPVHHRDLHPGSCSAGPEGEPGDDSGLQAVHSCESSISSFCISVSTMQMLLSECAGWITFRKKYHNIMVLTGTSIQTKLFNKIYLCCSQQLANIIITWHSFSFHSWPNHKRIL